MKNKLFSLFITLMITTNAGLCEQSRAVAIQDVAIKFGLAICGVILSSLIIYIGLTIYNKIISHNKSEYTIEEEILKTPKTTDEAIKFFINKNRIK